MTKEFLFIAPQEHKLELGNKFSSSEDTIDGTYLVSNFETENTLLYAPEVNFYLQCSREDNEQKARIVKRLYEARAMAYDLSQEVEVELKVGNSVALLANNDEQLLKRLREADIEVEQFPLSVVNGIQGDIGNFTLRVVKEKEEVDVRVDQLVWYDAPMECLKRKGIHDPKALGVEQTMEAVMANLPPSILKQQVKYQPSLCHSRGKRVEICGKCISSCPEKAIARDNQTSAMLISAAECVGCGMCVGACPTGAMESSAIPRSSFHLISNLFAGATPLLLSDGADIESLNVPPVENVVPYIIQGPQWLDECHYLTLLQSTGGQLVLYSESLQDSASQPIEMINSIFLKKYQLKAIHVCSNQFDLDLALQELAPHPRWEYLLDETGMSRRQIFSKRLAHVIGDNDLGVLEVGSHLDYGTLSINTGLCTLCLSCVDCCDTGALSACQDDNSLRFNPSLCTGCTYCQHTCPEPGCLELQKNHLSLGPDFCSENILAQDELFSCLECGGGFAPRKTIEKIAEKMKPHFCDDPLKTRCLYCCPDCKAKLMLTNISH